MIVGWIGVLITMAVGQLVIWGMRVYLWLIGLLIVVCSIAILVKIIQALVG